MNNNYFKKTNYENEKSFTMLKKNDTIKSQSSFKNSMDRISALTKPENMVIKNQTPTLKSKDPNQNKTNEQNKLPSNTFIPKEKKEQNRLLRATGSYDLKRVNPSEINKHLRLTQKTPDDYYSMSVPHKELTKRLDNEALGPKTDFSVWNYENNYDKLNKEEQGMLIHKMQLDLNNEGYKDYNGHSLKTDGIFGKKTESAYNQYRKDKQEELEDYNPKDRKIVEGKDYEVLKNEDGKPVLLASLDENLNRTHNGLDKSGTSKTNYSYIERDKEVLTKDDYKKVQIYQTIYDYAKNVLKDDAIADSIHREAVKIRRQDKYAHHEDYGPERIKEFDPSKGTQFVGVEGYTDGDYEYSDTKDTASIYISEPLSAFDAEYLSGYLLGIISNANAFTDQYPKLNMLSGVLDFVLSKTYPLYGKVHKGDFVVTIKRHKGGYRPTTEKEYKFYFSKDTNEIYYIK